ncbi:hypothetical protein KCP70_10060 [Salmonella enterica subsp. enterica]|nr:hypothetical protein KCP70_10060 [Salmonella enterica subsp. enterica]
MQPERSMRIFRHPSPAAIPPISSSGLRRITAHDPQKESGVPYRYRRTQSVKQRAFVRRFTKTSSCAQAGPGERNDAASASSPAVSLSGTSPLSFCRNERVGTWSQSNHTNSPFACFSALLMVPALACSCVARAM